MKKIQKLLVIGLLLSQLVLPANAQSTTEEATPSSVISPQEVKEKIKQRLQDVVEEKMENVKGVIEKRLQSKAFAYVGSLKSINDDFLIVETKEGEKKAKVASDSAIIFVKQGASKKNIKLKEAEIGQFTIAMGFMDKEEIINAKRVIFSPMPTVVKRKVIFGKVTEIDVNKLQVKSNGEEVRFSIDSSTDFKIKGLNKPKVADIQIEDKVVAILDLDKEDKVKSCKAIFIIPGKYSPGAEENAINATPSAQPSPSDTIEE